MLMIAIGGLLLLGLPVVWLLLWNGWYDGTIFRYSAFSFIHATYVLMPHAIFELPALYLGSRVGLESLLRLLKRFKLLPEYTPLSWRTLVKKIIQASGLLIVAAIMEVSFR